MAKHRIAASKLIQAPAGQLYAIIADYRDGHPHILPRPPFVSLEVEEGGTGAGTVINFQMRLMGRLQSTRAAITEPEPGRVLVETVLDQDLVTTFTVDPREGGQHAYVTITTDIAIRDGILGAVQGWLITRMLQPVYERELVQLGAVAAERAVGSSQGSRVAG
jgi:hypothetical protein